jgi:hypothetical protein
MGQYWVVVNLDKHQSIIVDKVGEFFWVEGSVIEDLMKPCKLPELYATSQAYKDLAPRIMADFYEYISCF